MNMFRYISNNLFAVKKLVGAELEIQANGAYSIRFIKLFVKNGLIQNGAFHVQLQSINQLKNSIEEGHSVSLVITGKGILQKQIASGLPDDKAKLLSVLPNADSGAFYVESYESASYDFISIARKDLVDGIITECQKEGVNLVDLHIGPFVIGQVVPLLKSENTQIIIEQHQFEIENDQILSYKKAELAKPESEVVYLNEQRTNSKLILSYATAFSFLIGNISQLDIEQIRYNLSEEIEKNKFKILGLSVLLFFFSILLINFFIFNHYEQRSIEITQLGVGMVSEGHLQGLKKEIAEKEKRLLVSAANFPYKYSYLIDRIAATVPSGIIWNEITVNPVKKTNSLTDKTFNQGTILINCGVNAVNNLYDWKEGLQSLAFTDSVFIDNYRLNEFTDKVEATVVLKLKQ